MRIWDYLIFNFTTSFAVQVLSHVWLFVTPWTAACQASLSFTIFWSLLKFTSIESIMPYNHFILSHSLLLSREEWVHTTMYIHWRIQWIHTTIILKWIYFYFLPLFWETKRTKEKEKNLYFNRQKIKNYSQTPKPLSCAIGWIGCKTVGILLSYTKSG